MTNVKKIYEIFFEREVRIPLPKSSLHLETTKYDLIKDKIEKK